MLTVGVILGCETVTDPPKESGSTITVAVIGVPGHPLAIGVIVKVAVCCVVVVFVRIPVMFPAPFSNPVIVVVLFLVQL